MSLRLVLSSDDGKTFFPENTSFDFMVKLNRTIQLDGYWVVAVTEINVTDRIAAKENQELLVYSDICQDSFVGDTEKPLLRRAYTETNNIIYSNPYYKPVKMGGLQQVHIYIKNRKGEKASFLKKKVTITLHLKKFPFVI